MHTLVPGKLLPVAIPRLLGTFTSDVEDQTFRFLVGTVPAWNLVHTWYNGTLVQWYNGTMVHWYIGKTNTSQQAARSIFTSDAQDVGRLA